MTTFNYSKLFQFGADETSYEKISDKGVSEIHLGGQTFLKIEEQALELIAKQGFFKANHLLRRSHLALLAKILEDGEASDNDKFVATELLKNSIIAAQMAFPSCQDTGTAIIQGKKGQYVLTGFDDEKALAKGVYDIYQQANLRFSQMAALDTYQEENTQTNLPAQIDIYANEGNEYHFLMICKGGGSANKTFLFQQTKTLLNEHSLLQFIKDNIGKLGTAACPPYHLAWVIGGTSAEATLKTVKLASTGYLDNIPTTGDNTGRAFRDLTLEKQILALTQQCGLGAQFGGKYFCHDVRVIRLPRHGGSCPVGLGVSCSADRNIKGKITRDGVFLEQLEAHPETFLPASKQYNNSQSNVININTDAPMVSNLAKLKDTPVMTRVILTGTLIVARDIVHAKLKEILDNGGELPQYFKDYPIYYAGPAKTPTGYASGSFGPTSAQRMDSYVKQFQAAGGSLMMLAKGNRNNEVREACRQYGGFYFGTIGGPAALLGKEVIKEVKVLDFMELGMEAVWQIIVKDFPAFIIINNKGEDFFAPQKNRGIERASKSTM